MRSSPSKIFISIVFFAILIIPVAASDKVGGGVSPYENRYLAKFPTVIVNKNQIAPGLKEGFEAWLKDNLVGRVEAQKAKAYIDFKLFASSPSPLVHIGEEGWYFFTDDRNLKIGQGTKLLSKEELEAISENQKAIQSSLQERGIDYVLVLVPSKASVYPEYMKGGNYQVGPTLIDQVTTYLQENTTVPVINIKPNLIDAKNEQDVYFRTDTHWNYAGAYIGYKTTIENLNNFGMIRSQPISHNAEPATHTGDLSIMLGYPGLIPPEPFERTIIQNPQASLVTDSEKIDQVATLISDNGIVGEYFSYSNQVAEKSALILGDSFFFSWKIPELFAENFAEMSFFRTEYVIGDIIDVINPDIVIFERTERYISYHLANPSTIKFNTPELNNLSAEIISNDCPTSIDLDRFYTIRIVVKNLGRQSWSEDDQIRLGVFPEGKDSGNRVFLPQGIIVESGQEYTFTVQNFQAPSQSITFFEFQMLQEGYQYFGDKERVDIVVK